MSRGGSHDFDCVIMSHDQFGKIPQSPEVQQKIINLCAQIGGEHYAALFEVMTCPDLSVAAVAMRHYIDESTLYRLRKKFYESWE